MTVISLLNRKGGVAKTTSTMNLAGEFHRRGLRVLSVDCDPQATLTLFAGLYADELPAAQTTLAALLPETFNVEPELLAASAPWGGDIWRASGDLAQAERDLAADVPGPHQRLRAALGDLAAGYDLVLVDSPPSVGKLVLNALGAADFLLVPVAADFASLGGLSKLFSTLELFRRYERPDLEILGIFGTQRRNTLHAAETLERLSRTTEGLLMQATIPQSVVVQDAQLAHQAVCQYNPAHKVADAYAQLADEIVVRLAGRGVELLARAAA